MSSSHSFSGGAPHTPVIERRRFQRLLATMISWWAIPSESYGFLTRFPGGAPHTPVIERRRFQRLLATMIPRWVTSILSPL